jgi:phosphoserine phosphatase
MSALYLVLTAAEGVSAAQIAAAEDAAGAKARRLGERSAELLSDAAGAGRAREALADEALDLNALRAEGRAKRLLIADMDSTIIPVECIDEIAEVAGVGGQVAEITERAMLGELDFEGALLERVALLKGLPEAALEEVWRERVRLNPGARVAVETMNARGAVTALVSGGFTYFADRVAGAAGFRFAQANRLLAENGVLTGAPGRPILGREAKLEALTRLSAEHGIPLAGTLAVGDGANDLAMVEAAGLGVAYRAKPALKAGADAALDHSDLTALLSLQGIPEAEFAA